MLTRNQTLWLAVLCLLIAAALRLAWLHTFPPGLHYDLAANVTLAGDIAWRGYRPVFISSYTGKETLFFYLVAPLMRLLGENPFTLRLTAAYAGLLTVAIAYPLGRVLFKDRRVALLGMLFLATSFWHILLSRYGFRAITQPLLQGLTIYFLWVGLADPGRKKPFALAGLFLGLAAYTYLAVRLFPIALALPLLLWWRQWRKLTPAGLLTLGVGGLVLLPLLAYFVSHSDAFWVRIGQVGQDGLTLPQALWRTLLMFNIQGDPYIRFNLPGRPLFDPLLSLFFIMGLGVTAWQLLRPANPGRQLTDGLLLSTLLVMVLPTALATNEIVPSNLRAVGLLPLVMFFPAVGLVWGVDYLKPQFKWLWVGGLPILLLLYGGWGYHLYFVQWGGRPDNFYENDGDLTVLAQQLNQHPEWAENPLYVSALHLQHPTLAALTPAYNQLKWLLESQVLVFPAAGPATYLFPHNSPPQAWMTPFLNQMTSQPGPLGPDGQPTFVRYTLPQPLTWQPSQVAQANFGYALLLHGYDVGSGSSGTDLPLTLYWEVIGQPAEPLLPFVHVEDQWQHRWAQVEPLAYPSEQWQVGEKIVQQIQVPLPAGTPPGRYRLRVGLFNAQTQNQMARFDASGRYAGNALVLEDVYVLPATQLPPALPVAPRPLTAQVAPGLTLLGYELNKVSQITTGEPLPLALWWHYDGQRPLPELFTRFDLIPASQVGQILTQIQPAHGSYPFSSWQGAQLVIDRQNPAVPLSLPAGWYTLHVRLLNGGGDTLYTTVLGEVEITAGERLFTPPATETQTTALFGSEITLLGYTLTADQKVTLVWQAAEKPTTSYTVFVHLLNPDGSCCVWQQDSLPRQGNYPTTRWLPNEVVVDEYQMELPAGLAAGEYPLEIGLYVAETGQRLTVTVPGQPPADFLYLRPVVKE